MKLIEEVSQSRSYSRTQNNQSRGNGQNSGDEQETVRNSMLNLLNVIDQSQPDVRQGNSYFRNVSQDALKQMHNNGARGDSPFEMYENPHQIGANNKV